MGPGRVSRPPDSWHDHTAAGTSELCAATPACPALLGGAAAPTVPPGLSLTSCVGLALHEQDTRQPPAGPCPGPLHTKQAFGRGSGSAPLGPHTSRRAPWGPTTVQTSLCRPRGQEDTASGPDSVDGPHGNGGAGAGDGRQEGAQPRERRPRSRAGTGGKHSPPPHNGGSAPRLIHGPSIGPCGPSSRPLGRPPNSTNGRI